MRILPACAWLIAAVVAGAAPSEEAAVGNEVRVVRLSSRAPAPEAFIPDRRCYRTVQETYDSAEALVSAHPGLASWTKIGESWERTNDPDDEDGFEMYALKLTNSQVTGTKPVLLVTAGLHGHDYAAPEFAMRFAEYVMDKWETDADVRWLLDHQELHVIPMTNPDSRRMEEYQGANGPRYRKSRNANYCKSAPASRGVDLNRNFTVGWGVNSGRSECARNYRGPRALSEPETEAVAGYAAEVFPNAWDVTEKGAAPSSTSGLHVDFHVTAELVKFPWNYSGNQAPNHDALRTVARRLAYHNGYRVRTRTTGVYGGVFMDHVYGKLGISAHSWTIGRNQQQDCATFDGEIFPENLPAQLEGFKLARRPWELSLGPAAESVALSGSASTSGVSAGTSVTLTATFDDTRYVAGSGEPTQNVAAGEYYVDTPPWATGASATSMTAQDNAWDEKSEAATATINTTGLASGRHTVFVRGQDAAGNWGPVSAAFLFIAEAPPTAMAAPRFTVPQQRRRSSGCWWS